MSTTTSKPKIKIDEEILTFLQTEEQKTTIVHCRIYSPLPTLARIWDSTYLLEENGNKVQLIKAFNISIAPNWTLFSPEGNFLHFTLLFEGLSKGCTLFQLVEDIVEPGGFFSDRIQRNKTDVYEVELAY
jgi:hypothetical protein